MTTWSADSGTMSMIARRKIELTTTRVTRAATIP